jgi:hypothetical protein
MSESDDNFLRILLDVCKKTIQNGKIQNARMMDLWQKHLAKYNVEYQALRPHEFDANEFVASNENRIEVLAFCDEVLVDAYWAIKMVAIALFQEIPKQLPGNSTFSSPEDVVNFKLRIAEKFVNALINFFVAERSVLEPAEFVYGIISTFLRVKKMMRIEEIQETLSKDGADFSSDELTAIMATLEGTGILKTDPADPSLYRYAKKLELAKEQEDEIQKEFFPIVEWAIESWRTLFNIRELNTPIPESYPQRKVLEHVVSYAATQGFTPAQFCLGEIKKYYEKML